MILMVGSEALNRVMGWNRETGDVDYWVSEDSITKVLEDAAVHDYRITEVSIGTFKLTKDGERIIEIKVIRNTDKARCDIMDFSRYDSGGFGVAELRTLRILKESHKFLKNSPHFTKTMRDIKEFRSLYPTFSPVDLALLRNLKKVTYNYSHPNLSQDKKGFFTGDGIDYKYDHDSIHEVVALSWRPAYKSYQHPEDQVKVSKELWNDLPYQTKIAGVIEEAMVLAIERHQVPNEFKPHPKKSFEMALQKLCTSITSGWFRDFAYDNYWEAMSLAPTDTYVERFKKAVENNKVKGYTL